MDPDEGENISEGTPPDSVPSSHRHSPPRTEIRERIPSLSLPRSNLVRTDPEQQDRRTTFEGDGMLPALGALAVLPAGVVRGHISDHASNRNATDHVLSSEGVSSASSTSGDGLSPPLVIGLNPRTIVGAQNIMPRSDNQQQAVGGSNHERARLGSVATSSAHSMVDREVLVMREAAVELSTASTPTPLGRMRRMSLFERANSISMPSNDGSGDCDTPHPKSERSNSSAMVKGRNLISIGLDENHSDHDHASALGRDKYNTVLRDWLMHVLEKDDQQNVEVSKDARILQ